MTWLILHYTSDLSNYTVKVGAVSMATYLATAASYTESRMPSFPLNYIYYSGCGPAVHLQGEYSNSPTSIVCWHYGEQGSVVIVEQGNFLCLGRKSSCKMFDPQFMLLSNWIQELD